MEKLNGRKILVTGGTGFVGGHLCEELIRQQANVVVPYRSCDPKAYFFTKKLNKKVVLANCDLKDKERLFDLISKYEIEYIFHLGAQAIVTTAYQNPWETITTNVIGTTNILEAARLFKSIKGVIIASSDKAYGKSSSKYRESDPLRGDHPYEVSKSSADLISLAYYKTYHLPVLITRFGNIYGPGDLNFNRIIPGIMESIIKKNQLEIRSNGEYVRDYVYVKDVVNAYLFLWKRLPQLHGESFNISSSNNLSVLGLMKKVEKIIRKNIKYKIINNAKNEIPVQQLDDSKLKKLGWRNKYTLDKAIKETNLWYKRFYAVNK